MDGLDTGGGESVTHRSGRDIILHGMGLALNSKTTTAINSFLAQLTADAHDTHRTTACVHGGGEEIRSGSSASKPSCTFSCRGPGLLDEGHPLLVLTVALVVLLLFPRLAGLCAVVGHL